MGFFVWLREGVRRAVLLGFSDAITEIGNRSEADDLGPKLATAWRQCALSPSVSEHSAETSLPAITPPNGRKRLGKSLTHIREAAQS